MLKKPKEEMNEAQMQPMWEYLTETERRLRRNNRLCRILQPLGSGVFLLNLLLSVMNLAKFAGGASWNEHFDAIPLLPSLVESMPRGSWSVVIIFTVLFSFGIPLAISAVITCISCILELQRDDAPPRPLNGTLAQRANVLANEAETVYELRRSMPTWSVYPEAGILTALSALPILMTLLQYAESAEPSAIQIALYSCVLLLCLFVLFWVYALLFHGFSLLNSLFFWSAGEWKLYRLYQTLDAYWETVDPEEFARRDRRTQELRRNRRTRRDTE